MTKAKTLVLRTAGSNCDLETVHAFQQVGSDVRLVHINQIIAGAVRLSDFQILAIPGGFTYGDDVSAGKILANEMKFKLKEQLTEFAAAGKLILGICNGFQVLVKAGLLPEVQLNSSEQLVTLTHNDSGKFEDRWVYLKATSKKCAFTNGIEKLVYFPVAHAEGKFVARDDATLSDLYKNDQIVFQYAAPTGELAGYPWNPNGSIDNIAGICDPSGHILGLMPHPERHFHPTHHPRWTREGLKPTADGVLIFRNAVTFIQQHF
ncbi:MAG: phosphoribosylformylglycinamidine synthase I [candidate division KSB1 bacterium]|nr:phosphoribosylformylglycinamidine synthase I [candidate division KSB1 bacterium]MDZ7342728.1 phosphoribosylformylglycinamidine synthase I [candidate division KSB1 bacterium]